MIIKFKRLHPDATLPRYGREGDACLDLFPCCAGRLSARTDIFSPIPTGLAVELPPGYAMLIRGRSGHALKGIQVFHGTIDSNYRGEIKILAMGSSLTYSPEMAIAQALIQRVDTFEPEWADELTDTNRGEAGFGSSDAALAKEMADLVFGFTRSNVEERIYKLLSTTINSGADQEAGFGMPELIQILRDQLGISLADLIQHGAAIDQFGNIVCTEETAKANLEAIVGALKSTNNLIEPLKWGKSVGLSRGQTYSAVLKLPPGVKIKIGGRLWLDAQRLARYLNSGGDLATNKP